MLGANGNASKLRRQNASRKQPYDAIPNNKGILKQFALIWGRLAPVRPNRESVVKD
jgi:hypothetical protein